MKNLSLIAALGYNNEIGVNNKLPWHIREDLEFYKDMTIGKNIIMGRKTFETMPEVALKRRYPIVLSTHQLDRCYDVCCYNNIIDLLNYIADSNSDFMVVGGAKTYEAFIPYVDIMYLTEIYKEYYEADTYFPVVDFRFWDSIKIADHMDEEVPYERHVYVRKKAK